MPDGSHKERVYWTLRAERSEKPFSEWEWIDAVHTSLRAAVERRRLPADCAGRRVALGWP